MKYLIITLITISMIFLNSCGFIFNAIFLDDHCRKCEVVNMKTNDVLWKEEACGGGTAGMEKKAKVKAYDLSHESNYYDLCNLEVFCEDWTIEENNNTE